MIYDLEDTSKEEDDQSLTVSDFMQEKGSKKIVVRLLNQTLIKLLKMGHPASSLFFGF